jgi:hypothetical protein
MIAIKPIRRVTTTPGESIPLQSFNIST